MNKKQADDGALEKASLLMGKEPLIIGLDRDVQRFTCPRVPDDHDPNTDPPPWVQELRDIRKDMIIMDKKQAKALAKAAKKEAKQASKQRVEVKDHTPDLTRRSTEAAERNARIRMWQLIVAILAGVAVTASVVWQIFFKAS